MDSIKVINRNIKISIIINIMITICTIVASIMMFTGFKFMRGQDIVLESTRLGMLRFFTVQSNMFMGIVAMIFAIQEIKLLKGKTDEISKVFYVLKLMSTTAVGLTFFVVFAYLGPISKGGIPSMLRNSNLFFHLIIPLASIITFTVFEKTDKLPFKYVICGIVPTFVYGIYYMGNIFLHMEAGKVSTKYDWYWFVQNGVWTAIIVVPLLYAITYLISLILWRINGKKYNEKSN